MTGLINRARKTTYTDITEQKRRCRTEEEMKSKLKTWQLSLLTN